jgi:hypothetical protein
MLNPHINYPFMSENPSNPGHGFRVLSPTLNHPISKKIRLQQLKLLLRASHRHRSFTTCEKSSYTHSSEETADEGSIINKRPSSITQVLHGDESCEDHQALSKKNGYIQVEDHHHQQQEEEKEQDFTNAGGDKTSYPSSSASLFSVRTKQEILSQLLHVLSTRRPCPCTCTKSNCLFLYCECYSLKKREKGAQKKLKLQSGLSRKNACHEFCKCRQHANHHRPHHILSTFSRISNPAFQ